MSWTCPGQYLQGLQLLQAELAALRHVEAPEDERSDVARRAAVRAGRLQEGSEQLQARAGRRGPPHSLRAADEPLAAERADGAAEGGAGDAGSFTGRGSDQRVLSVSVFQK